VKTLNQGERQPLEAADQVAVVFAATNGFLDRISEDRVEDFNRDLIDRLHAEIPDELKQIGEGEWPDEVQDKLRGAVEQFAEDFGYDLDEEGQPEEREERGEEERETSEDETREQPSGEGDGEGEEREGEEERSGAVAAGQR
jgi:F-type H+-transporting ATPase subunit alpha